MVVAMIYLQVPLYFSWRTIELGKPSEYAFQTKWIDKDRALVNKSSSRNIHFPDGRCYIYHIGEDRWEYIADGYGFDYDALRPHHSVTRKDLGFLRLPPIKSDS